MDEAFGHWLAGFIDGEGCFAIDRKTDRRWSNGTMHRYQCRFAVKLRRDDEPILHEIVRQTGIGYVISHPQYPSRRATEHPQSEWLVLTKGGCLDLVRLLQRHPLRAKKARDFEIWAHAVWLWAGISKGNRFNRTPNAQAWADIADLRDALSAGRTYEGAWPRSPAAGFAGVANL